MKRRRRWEKQQEEEEEKGGGEAGATAVKAEKLFPFFKEFTFLKNLILKNTRRGNRSFTGGGRGLRVGGLKGG